MPLTKGIFISDVHLPDNIPLRPVFDYMKDFKPDVVILGGDIIDAKGMHGADSMRADQVDMGNYERDCKLLYGFLSDIRDTAPRAHYVYLEGNHCERYKRLARKYPKVFADAFNIPRDAFPKGMGIDWVEYGTYQSSVEIGDTTFIHGNIWPDAHAKAYATRYTPNKVVYGHLHHYQAYTTHRATPSMSPRYAVTAGCLCKLDPEWKRGEGHKWQNGFISFMSNNGTTVPTVHLIENGMFNVGAKVYK